VRLALALLAGCGGLFEPVAVEPADGASPPTPFDAHRESDASPEASSMPCVPGGTIAYMPEPLPPPNGKHQNRCTQHVLDVYTGCAIDHDMNACSHPWGTVSKDCLECLQSTMNDPSWGPEVSADQSLMYLNIEGCINLATGQSGPTSCGQRLHDIYGCERVACAECAPSSFMKCVELTRSGVCKKYEDAFALDCANLGSYPETDNCFRRANETDSRALRIRMDAYFCGP